MRRRWTVSKLSTKPLRISHSALRMTLLNQTTPDMVFHYTTNWKENKVCQMWIEEVGKNLYVAVAYNPEKDKSMTMSNPRGYFDTLDWVQGWCGSFSILPTHC